MVLVAVLWIVAALSLIVTGMIHSVRGEVRQVGLSSQMAQGTALGGGAISVVLQGLVSSATLPAGIVLTDIKFQGRDIEVQARPLTGFIDMNLAQLPLLERLFRFAADLPPPEAALLAQAVIDHRARADQQGRPLRFEAVEDLLQVQGLDYEVYAKVAELLTADARGSGRVNVLAAPVSVLVVLADGSFEIAERIARDRDAGALGFDTTGLNPALVDNASSRRYVIQARVPLADGAWLLTSRWVDLSGGRPEGLPWRIFHADSRLQAALP